MTRPTSFSGPRVLNVSTGGDPTLPDGQPTVDCCVDDPTEMPDRAADGPVFIGTTSYDGSAAVIADGPDFYYLYNEPSGSFADSSGNAVAVLENGGTVTRSVSGGPASTIGISATGAPVYLETTFNPSNSTTAETLEAWVKTTSTGHIRLFNSRRTFGLGFFLDIGATGFGAAAGQVSAYINGTSLWQGKHSTATVNDGNLHHIAAKLSGTAGVAIVPAQMTIYIDGVPVSTTNDAGNTGSQNAPIAPDTVALLDEVTSGSVSVWGQAFFSSALSDARILAHADTGGATTWAGAGPEITDGDDATYQEVTGTGVLRIDLGAPFEIARVRLLIGTATSGSRSYTLYGANIADFSDAVLVTTLAFTATGSFTAQEVTDTWTPTDSYQFWELDGNDETRYIYSFELYEAAAEDASAVAAALDDHLTDPTDAHDASAVSIVDTGGYFTGTDVEAALQELGAGGASALPWFDVTAYGALNDGTTNDTSAINSAIAALNTATRGVLYFPAGAGYKVTSALTTITASGLVMGDGMGAYDGSAYVSAVLQTSQTANLFTITGKTLVFQNIGLFNTYAGNPSAGAGIQVSGSFIGQKVDLESVVVAHFYDNVVRDVGAQWTNHNVWNWGPVRYGESIQNTVNQDAGDWNITDCFYYADTHNGTAAIFQTGAGGGKIVNVKTNGHGGATFTNAIKVAIPTSRSTSILHIASCSLENMSGDAILVTTTGTGIFGLLTVNGCDFGMYSNSTGRAVKVSAATNGVFLVAGSIAGVTIDGGTMLTDGTARAAIELVNTDRVTLGTFQLVGFNARYTSSGDTNTTDSTTPSFATPAIVLGTAAAAGAAATVIRSDSTIVAFDATVPVTQAFSDSAATGSATVAARRDHKHGMMASPTLTAGVLLIADTHSTPLIFADLIQTDAQDDLLYAD